MMRTIQLAVACVAVLLTTAGQVEAGLITSANGQPWDFNDSQGYIGDGGQDAFDRWGQIAVGVNSSSRNLVGVLNLNQSGQSASTPTPFSLSGVNVTRSLFNPAGTDYLRYFDSFTNNTGSTVSLTVGWGGNLGSDSGTVLSATSSGDLVFDSLDTWGLTIENFNGSNPAGPATDPPVGYVVGNTPVYGGTLSSPYSNSPWSGNGNDNLAFLYAFDLQPGETSSLAYFLYRGLAENRNGPLGQFPTTGEEIALAQSVLSGLAASPDFSGLTQAEIGRTINFTSTAVPEPSSLALFGISACVAGIGAARRRRHEKQQETTV